MKKLFIDIGGTYIRSELIDNDHTYCETVSSEQTGLLHYIDAMLFRFKDIEFIGISFAGQVENGEILSAPNIDIDCYELETTVKKRYGIDLILENDLNCAVLAEADYWNTDSIAVISVGTGIGAAVIDQGKLVRGNHNAAFEVGHIPYKIAPFACGCGRSNCIEIYASGSGISKWMKYEKIETELDLERFKTSSSCAERSIAVEFETALLHACGIVVTLANPKILVLGGGIINKNPYLITSIRDHLQEYALSIACDGLRIEQSMLQNPSLMGAKMLEKRRG